ncbi:MAG TPA: hypothetical protein PK280_13560 [Planctomycetota bacterium]|nr:hypothetical protein [Planctomycetota bacterium]
MAGGPANISSPEIIRRFRSRFVEFDADCRRALEGSRGEIVRIEEWLRRDQTAHWKQRIRKCEEQVEQARRDYQSALHNDGGFQGKKSAVDEKKALDRALRAKAEAEAKLQAVKRWLLSIEKQVADVSGACLSLASLLDATTPRALARMDSMLDSLDSYVRPDAARPNRPARGS